MNKKVLLIVGLIAVAGVGYYFYTSSKKSIGSGGSVDGGSGDGGSGDGGSGDGGDGGTRSATNTGIKGLKGADRKDFRQGTREVCQEKYGSGKDYRDCKKRVKDGGVAFDGGFMDDFSDDNFGL